MKSFVALFLLASCASHPAPSPATPAPIVHAALVTHPIEVGRLDDLTGNTTLTANEPGIKVDGNVVSVYVCRPDGSAPRFVADDEKHAYVTFAKTELGMPPPDPNGQVMAKPAEYCSFQRFTMPDGVTYVGELPK
ncbi:MAG TPA: hypothetical protein VGM90_26660 [Kofleriaceae bacterium]|jgi:hypothetical protein